MTYNLKDYEHAGSCKDCGGLLVRHKSTGEIFHAYAGNAKKCKKYG